MVEWAFYQLLLNARDERGPLSRRLFDEAVFTLRRKSAGTIQRSTRIRSSCSTSPSAIANRTIVERLAGKIRNRRPAKKATKDLLKRAEGFLTPGT